MNGVRGLVSSLALALAALASMAVGAADVVLRTEAGPVRLTEVVRGLDKPWSIAFLPDGRLLLTERPGRMRIAARDGTLSAPLAGVPAVHAEGQGGLLDVALSPDFATDQRIVFSYAQPTPTGARTAVARARLDVAALKLDDVKLIFSQNEDPAGKHHWGSRLVFDRAGNLFVTLGDRFHPRERAQALDSHLGKIVRIDMDGSVPADNPFLQQAGASPEIWSYGHRNVQGAALHPLTGQLWTHEHGPQGGDELNLTRAGANHGWPRATWGCEYVTCFRIGEKSVAGLAEPQTRWVPSIAPSGLAFVTSERYPGWKGSVLVGALKARALVRLTLDGERVTGEERLLTDLEERIRDIRQGPDGWIYLLTDAPEGRILRLAPTIAR